MSLYRPAQVILRAAFPAVARYRVEGRQHVPRTGPFILMANHRSILDAVFAQVACPRVVHTLTKSSQFRSPAVRWLLGQLQAFPVRRYRVDPQAVRTVLRLLEDGQGVGVFPEAERSWDGRPQPFRRGTVRLIMKAGVPVVPCGISGSYEVWPRWSRRPGRGRVTVRFGPPLDFGTYGSRQAREEAFDDVEGRLRQALWACVDEPAEVAGSTSETMAPDPGPPGSDG